MQATTWFDTYEAREAAFNAAVGRMIPRRSAGPHVFWDDFQALTGAGADPGIASTAYITSHPLDCLAFGTPLQVLAAARMRAARVPAARVEEIPGIAMRFELSAALDQPLRSLSGGETVRMALAKSVMAAACSDRLVIASPFCWLSDRHLPLLREVAAAYGDLNKPVHILALAGEENRNPMGPAWLEAVPFEPLDFSMQLTNLRISLGLPVNAISAEPAYAGALDFSHRLVSPCLVVGDNGQGKSLLAKALSGAVVCDGTARIRSSGSGPRPRLLFQDVITQALLRTPAATAGAGGHGRGARALAVEILADAAAIVNRRRGTQQRQAQQDSILGLKAMLVAARLSQPPAALILDEPDWGLSRDNALGFVLAAVRQSHAAGVPVLLISHKPWWRPMARSVIAVARTQPVRKEDRFAIVTTLVNGGDCR